MCYVWYGNCESSNEKDMCMWERNEGLDECLARAGFLVGDDGCADRIRKFTA